MEPNRIAESLKAVAWGWVRPFLHRFGCTRLPRLRRVERKGIAPVANSMTSQKPFSSVRLPLGLNGEVLAPNNLPSTRPKRWVAGRKTEILAAVEVGLLTVEEACARYGLCP